MHMALVAVDAESEGVPSMARVVCFKVHLQPSLPAAAQQQCRHRARPSLEQRGFCEPHRHACPAGHGVAMAFSASGAKLNCNPAGPPARPPLAEPCMAQGLSQGSRRGCGGPLAGLTVYPSYMGGGGYVLSADLAAALVAVHTHVAPLKHTTAEDITMAMWLLPFDGVRRVDHPGFRTQAGHCCAQAIERWERPGGCIAQMTWAFA